MGISASVTNNQITATVGETQIDVAVSGGVGPTGSSGTVAVSAPITNAGTTTAANIGLSVGTGLAVSGGSLVVSYGTGSTVACRGDDARLSDSREWSADTVSQAEAEAGSSTTRRAFTPQRVFQAIAAWWAASASKTKLDGIAAGATANATDAQLRDRSTHTGTQTASTISDFTTAVIAAAPPTTNASLLTSGTLPDARLSSNIARTSDVSSAVAAVVNAAPASLDTLKELADALGNDANFASTVTNAIAGKAAAVHTHVIADVTGLQTALDGKQASGSYAASVHTHGISDVTGLQTALDGKQAAGSYAAASHGHSISDVTGLQTALDGKQASGSYAAAVHTHGISDVTGLQTALDGKAATSHSHAIADVTGLQTALDGKQASGSYAAATHSHAISDVTGLQTALDGKAALSHAHSASDTTSGVFDIARIPVGTSSATVAAGNDARFTDQRVPTDGSVTDAKITSGGLSASSINWVAIAPWAANTNYAKGDLVSFQGIAYRRSAAGTSGATFNVANWQQITPGEFVGSQITSGTVPIARLGTGSPSASNFLRGDGTFAAAGSTNASDLVSGTLAYSLQANPTVTSPSQITSSQNDYASFARGINRFTTNAARDLTGMVAGADGEVRVLTNVGTTAANTLTIKDQSSSSTAANRFAVPWAGDCIIANGASVVVYYDNTTQRWRVV